MEDEPYEKWQGGDIYPFPAINALVVTIINLFVTIGQFLEPSQKFSGPLLELSMTKGSFINDVTQVGGERVGTFETLKIKVYS